MRVKDSKNCCSGCTACYTVCDNNAISMSADEEGFAYPEIDSSKCINCGKCKRACPFDDRAEGIAEQSFFVGAVNDASIKQRSRSGGAFYALASEVIKRGGVVYGAALDSQYLANTTKADSLEGLKALQGSKYVQSNKGNVFFDIIEQLNSGREVLFSGTPCEVAGLKSALSAKGVEQDRLYTVDLICHGVPSPMIWQDNINELEAKYGKKVASANFRDKSLGWRSHIESYVLENGKKVFANKYTTLFYSHVMIRPSCHNCCFASFNRPGDITLGDCWDGMDMELPFEKSKGISQIIVSSKKGARLIEDAKDSIALKQISKDNVRKNPTLFNPTAVSSQRDAFWNDYRSMGYANASKKYYPLIERIKIPYNLIKAFGGK